MAALPKILLNCRVGCLSLPIKSFYYHSSRETWFCTSLSSQRRLLLCFHASFSSSSSDIVFFWDEQFCRLPLNANRKKSRRHLIEERISIPYQFISWRENMKWRNNILRHFLRFFCSSIVSNFEPHLFLLCPGHRDEVNAGSFCMCARITSPFSDVHSLSLCKYIMHLLCVW